MDICFFRWRSEAKHYAPRFRSTRLINVHSCVFQIQKKRRENFSETKETPAKEEERNRPITKHMKTLSNRLNEALNTRTELKWHGDSVTLQKPYISSFVCFSFVCRSRYLISFLCFLCFLCASICL